MPKELVTNNPQGVMYRNSQDEMFWTSVTADQLQIGKVIKELEDNGFTVSGVQPVSEILRQIKQSTQNRDQRNFSPFSANT